MYQDGETPRFWITYAEPLRKYLTKRVAHPEAVEDILHDVYLKIFCYCKRYNFCCQKAGVRNLRSWVFQTGHNAMVDYLRRQSRYTEFKGAGAEPTTESSVSSNDTLWALFRQLPPQYALPLYYDAVLDMKQTDIAREMKISLSAAKSRIQRAKKMLGNRYRELNN